MFRVNSKNSMSENEQKPTDIASRPGFFHAKNQHQEKKKQRMLKYGLLATAVGLATYFGCRLFFKKASNEEQRKVQVKQLNSLHKMYHTCLLSQSNVAKIYSGLAQTKHGMSARWQEASEYRNRFFQIDRQCEQYKMQRDELYHQLYSQKKPTC